MAMTEFETPAGLPIAVSAANPLPTTGGGGGSTTANQGTPNTAANAWPVIPTDAGGVNQQEISAAGNAGVAVRVAPGAANLATAQVVQSTSPASLVVARATRRWVTIKNIDAAITCYVGPHSPTLTSSNGMPLLAGESIVLAYVGQIDSLSASATPTLAVADHYD